MTSRPLIFLQKEAVLSSCNFASAHLTACILRFLLPLTSRPMKWRTLSQRRTRKSTLTPRNFYPPEICDNAVKTAENSQSTKEFGNFLVEKNPRKTKTLRNGRSGVKNKRMLRLARSGEKFHGHHHHHHHHQHPAKPTQFAVFQTISVISGTLPLFGNDVKLLASPNRHEMIFLQVGETERLVNLELDLFPIITPPLFKLRLCNVSVIRPSSMLYSLSLSLSLISFALVFGKRQGKLLR